MLYMVLEYFKNDDALPIYRRFRGKGRMMSEGLSYVASWIDEDMRRCFQVMETDDEKLLKEWIAKWDDIVDFEYFPVMTSAEMVEKIAPKL
jgi:hypothetical protein